MKRKIVGIIIAMLVLALAGGTAWSLRDLPQNQPRWLLTMLNDYGYTVLLRSPFDLHHFGTLERAAALAARHLDAPPSPAVTDAVYLCLDSLWALPHDDFSYMCSLRVSKSTSTFGEVTVPVGMYEEVQQEHHEDGTKHWRPSYESETKKEEQNFAVNRDTYLAPGYVKMTLDTADGNFVSRLRAAHPQFSEEDIRLCMLARLQLSNTAISAIYVISVSAVQHRKQKLKKEGFGVTDPAVTFDQIIANF